MKQFTFATSTALKRRCFNRLRIIHQLDPKKQPMIREPFSNGRKPTGENVGRLTARIYGIMAVTTLGTFGMLNAIYELFFRPDIFA